MALSNFIPDLWAANLLVNLEKRSVATAICNRDYEGLIRGAGDSVKLTSLADPTIGSYTVHTDITIEDIDDATQSLLIDQAKYFAFELDDIERAQAVDGPGALAEQTRKAAYLLADTLDTAVLSAIGTGASAADPDHQVAEATINTAAGAYDALVNWSVLLDGQNVPEFDRYAVVSPAFYGLILKDSRFVGSGDAVGASVRANGRVGQAAGFDLYKSNNLPAGPGAGAGTSMIAGYRGACTLAEQIVSVEAARMEKRFADMVKGLHVYGFKVTRPKALVSADVIVA